MTNDMNKILATKKAWRTAERRKNQRMAKDGTPEDRKTTADAIRRGHEIEQNSMRPGFWKKIVNMFLPVILIAIIATPVHAYTDKQIVSAIYMAEGGSHAQYPYGIRSMHVSTLDEARKICFNTIHNNRKRYQKYGYRNYPQFIQFLGSRFCPTKGRNLSASEKHLNKNWVKNVNYFLRKQNATV